MSRYGTSKDKESIGLSKREREVVSLLVQGKTNQEIASELGIQEKTVKYHCTSIYAISQCKNRAQFIAQYYSNAISS